jgi:hypothetical protein
MKERDAIRAMFQNPEFKDKMMGLFDRGRLQSEKTVPLDRPINLIGGVWPSPIDGSKAYPCVTCEEPVSIAPSGQEMMKIRGEFCRVKCLQCAMKEAQR